MAKRFTDTNKYKKPFVRGLPGAYKLLWDFLYHDCDHAGIWIVDFEIAQTYVGSDMPIDRKGALLLFNEGEQRIIEIDGGKKWFLPSFIEFQYVQLSDKNRAHLSVISSLKKYGLLNPDNSVKKEFKGHTSPLQGDKDKVKEQDMDMDQDFGKSENLLLVPEMMAVFKKANPTYPGSIEKDYKPLYSIAKFLCEQGGLRGSPDLHGEKILEAWQGLSGVITRDNFYRQKSLSTISNHIQEITQIGINGSDQRPNNRKTTNRKDSGAHIILDDLRKDHFKGQ